MVLFKQRCLERDYFYFHDAKVATERPQSHQPLLSLLALGVGILMSLFAARAHSQDNSETDSEEIEWGEEAPEPDVSAKLAQQTHYLRCGTGEVRQRCTRSMKATRIREKAMTIDGELNEPEWRMAPVNDGFVEQVPYPGTQPKVNTEFWVLYDSEAIYVAVKMELLPGEKPRGASLLRDNVQLGDDSVFVRFDVRHDRRSSIAFGVTPSETQVDFLALENGAVTQTGFDTIFESGVKINKTNWVVEFRFPFTSLGVSSASEATNIGFQVTRGHATRQSVYNWNPVPPGLPEWGAATFGDLEGVKTSDVGRQLTLSPFILAQIPSADGAVWDSNDPDFGLKTGGEIRMQVLDNLWVEATALTDFTEIRADNQLINLDRFPLVYPELRPFFLYGQDMFEFGIPETAQVYFSRRIGLDDEGRPVPLWGGFKTYGKVGDLNVGALSVMTQSSQGKPESLFSVGRLRYNLGESVTLGTVVTRREIDPFGHTGEGDSTSVGVDSTLRLADNRLEIFTYGAAIPDGGELNDKRLSGSVSAAWLGESWRPKLSTLFVGEQFLPAVGFVRRPGVIDTKLTVPWVHYVQYFDLQSIELSATGNFITDQDGKERLGTSAMPQVTLTWADRKTLQFAAEYFEDVVQEPFDLFTDITIAPDNYRGMRAYATLGLAPNSNPTCTFNYVWNNNFFGGELHSVSADALLSITKHIRVESSASWSRAKFIDSSAHYPFAINSMLTLAMSANLGLDWVAQYSNLINAIGGLARFRWRFMPGSDLFLVYRQSRSDFEPLQRSLTLKVSFRWDALY